MDFSSATTGTTRLSRCSGKDSSSALPEVRRSGSLGQYQLVVRQCPIFGDHEGDRETLPIVQAGQTMNVDLVIGRWASAGAAGGYHCQGRGADRQDISPDSRSA